MAINNNYTNFKTPIFTNINDQPQAPTQNQAGNASDTLERKNNIADALDEDLSNLDSRIGNNESNISSLQSQVGSIPQFNSVTFDGNNSAFDFSYSGGYSTTSIDANDVGLRLYYLPPGRGVDELITGQIDLEDVGFSTLVSQGKAIELNAPLNTTTKDLTNFFNNNGAGSYLALAFENSSDTLAEQAPRLQVTSPDPADRRIAETFQVGSVGGQSSWTPPVNLTQNSIGLTASVTFELVNVYYPSGDLTFIVID